MQLKESSTIVIIGDQSLVEKVSDVDIDVDLSGAGGSNCCTSDGSVHPTSPIVCTTAMISLCLSASISQSSHKGVGHYIARSDRVMGCVCPG